MAHAMGTKRFANHVGDTPRLPLFLTFSHAASLIIVNMEEIAAPPESL
jgi:hypothetical protein